MRVDWAGAIENENLGKIFIGGEEFTGIGYQGLMTVNTKTYVEEPIRQNDGSMKNINDHDTFIVPRCKVNFKFFNIRDYQRLCRVINSANEFPVSYFDKQFGEFRTYMMYVEPEEMAKIYNVGTSVIGILDYEVSFIGTLNDLETFKVIYLPKYWNGTTLVDLMPVSIDYSSTTTYYKGQKVYWNGSYYQAIYYENSFKGIYPTNTSYWQVKEATLWNDITTYTTGDLVYRDTTTNSGTVRKYYEAKKEDFYGFLPTNTTYWKEVTISAYSDTKTYAKGGYAFLLVGDVKTIYQAIYYKEEFSGQSPDDTKYWAKITPQINVEQEVDWGKSIHILTATDLADFYKIPEGKTLKGWNTRADGTGLNILPNSNWSVFENTTIYPIIGV